MTNPQGGVADIRRERAPVSRAYDTRVSFDTRVAFEDASSDAMGGRGIVLGELGCARMGTRQAIKITKEDSLVTLDTPL